MAKVYILIEVWGRYRDEVRVTIFSRKKIAVAAFKKSVEDYLEGSGRDVDKEVKESVSGQYGFDHNEGFILMKPEMVNHKL